LGVPKFLWGGGKNFKKGRNFAKTIPPRKELGGEARKCFLFFLERQKNGRSYRTAGAEGNLARKILRPAGNLVAWGAGERGKWEKRKRGKKIDV